MSKILSSQSPQPQTQIWLMKSEPDVFSLADLRNCANQTSLWDGVRNYQARNFMRDQMRPGDCVLFYHSNCAEPGIAGLAKVSSNKALPDPTQFDPKSPYYDPKSTPDNPRWVAVSIQYVRPFKQLLSLQTIKHHPQLSAMKVAQRGQRLSIQPVDPAHFSLILQLADG